MQLCANVLTYLVASFLFLRASEVDTSFKPELPQDYTVKAVSEQPDGKIIVGGTVNDPADDNAAFIARLAENGDLDKSFHVHWGKSSAAYSVNQIQVRPDRNVLVFGDIWSIHGTPVNLIALFSKQGLLHNSYQAEELSGAVKLLRDGGVLYTAVIPDQRRRDLKCAQLRRLDSDGNKVWESEAIRQQSPYWGEGFYFTWCEQLEDGTIVGGLLNPRATYRGLYAWYWLYSSAWGLMRLDIEWRSLTQWYDMGGAGAVIVSGPANTLYVGGRLDLQTMTRRIAGWQIDASFQFQSPETNAVIQALAVQRDGKVLYSFHHEGNTNRIYRCNVDGSFDASFRFGENADACVQSLLILRSGKALAWGSFADTNGLLKRTFVRLNTE
jgi:hypothetical protein